MKLLGKGLGSRVKGPKKDRADCFQELIAGIVLQQPGKALELCLKNLGAAGITGIGLGVQHTIIIQGRKVMVLLIY